MTPPLHRSESDMGWIKRRLDKLERDIQQQAAARRIASSTIGANGALRSGNYVPGADGWAINGDGSAEFDQLTVRDGLIAPGAITSQVLTETNGGYANPMGTAHPTLTVSFTMPAWATNASALVTGAVQIEAGNIGFCYGKIDGNESAGMLVVDGAAAVTHQRSWAPTPGASFDIVLRADELSSTACNWQLQLGCMAVFTRGV